MGQFGSFGQRLRISCLSRLLRARHHCSNHFHCSRLLGLWCHHRRLRATYCPRFHRQGNYCLINFNLISCSKICTWSRLRSALKLLLAPPAALAHFLHVDDCLLRQLQPQGWCTDWQDRRRSHSSRPYQYVNLYWVRWNFLSKNPATRTLYRPYLFESYSHSYSLSVSQIKQNLFSWHFIQ